jgi:hypothetical protein
VQSPSTARSERSPDGIKDALSAFQVGREIADPDLSRSGPRNPNAEHSDSEDSYKRDNPDGRTGS